MGGSWRDGRHGGRLQRGLLESDGLAFGGRSLDRFRLLLDLSCVPRQVVEVALSFGEFSSVRLAQLLPMVRLLGLCALLRLELLLFGRLILAWRFLA